MPVDTHTAEFFSQLRDPFTAEQIFEHIPDIVFFIKDKEGCYVAANRTLVERCGLQSRDQLLGRRPSEVLGPTLGRSYEEQDSRVVASGISLTDRLELHVMATGETGWCLTTKTPLYGRDDSVIGLVGVSRDLRLPDVQSDDYAHLAEVVSYVGSHLAERPRINELAALAGMSVFQLDRRMQRVFGLTTGQWVLKTRLAHASHLLAESELPVAVVAQEAGYADQSAFTRQFRRSTGLSPSEYRQIRSIHRKNQN